LAVRLPQEVNSHSLFATFRQEKLGTLLFFDPTETLTSFGYLPPSLQANYGLLVSETGELVQLPVLPPSTNQMTRTATLNIDGSGKLTGTVEEIRTGPAEDELRDELAAVPKIERQKVFQSLLSRVSDGAVLTRASITDLGNFTSPLIIEYGFTLSGYAQHLGNLYLFRPCALGHKGEDLLEDKPRQQPVVFSHTAQETDSFEIPFPAEYSMDEVPRPMQYDSPFAGYKSELHGDAHTLHYSRMYELKNLRVQLEQVKELKQFFRTISDDERAYAILTSSSSVSQK